MSRTYAKVRSAVARINAARLRINGAVPIGSRVSGLAKGLRVGPGFFASGPIWLEAITEYEGARYAPTLEIGSNVRSSPRLHVSAVEEVIIGDWCLFGENVFIADHQHGTFGGSDQSSPMQPPALRPLGGVAPVSIGDRCQLGNNVVVLPGAHVGNGCIVGANSVVRGEVAPNTIVAGVPARPIKRWDATLGAWVSLTA